MITPASVLLPEPFGPMSACVSPRRIVIFTPLRIVLPPTATCKFLISSVSVISVLSTQYSGTNYGSRRNLLMIKQRLIVRGRGHIPAVMRHRQFVIDLHAHRRTALPRDLVPLDLVLY